MAILPEHVTLVRQFEPILYFNRLNPFFPSDAKRYVEHCALWRADLPFDDKNSWGGLLGTPFPRTPRIAHGKIAALASEVRPGDTFLGSVSLTTDATQERFLDLAGWLEPMGPGTLLDGLNKVRQVTSESENRFASLSGILGVEGLYDAYHDVLPGSTLKESRFWYHAEVFDQERIRNVMAAPRSGLDFGVLLKRFPDPLLICYYLFFPGHIAPLEGCETTFIGPRFGSFGGDWACIALLLNRSSASAPYAPRFIGLTSRNIGQLQFLDAERRVGMDVAEWTSPTTITTVGDHPRLFVARNTNGLYRTPGAKPLQPFTPADPGLDSCGTIESLDEAIPYKPDDTGLITIVVLKLLVPVIGPIWGAFEAAHSEPFSAAPAPSPQQDYPPEDGVYGVILKPQGLVLPDAAQAQQEIPWSVPQADHSMTAGGRTYSFMVDRRETDPQKLQVWWPSDGTHVGYDGRWGSRVANDPRRRRAGMRFPNFALMFFRRLQQELSK